MPFYENTNSEELPSIIHNKAALFAVKAHAGQLRRDKKTPYCTHPLRVATLLSMHHASDIEILCGTWHDVLEDVPEMRGELFDELISYGFPCATNLQIVNILEALNKPLEGNRQTRLTNFVKQIIRCGESAIMVKNCDRIDNVMDSEGLGDFAEEYVVNETGYIIKEFDKLQGMNGRCLNSLATLKQVRKGMMEKKGWGEDKN